MPGDPALMELREAYLKGGLVVFAGAGVSAAAGLPSREQLVEALLESARARGVAPERLDEISILARQGKVAEALSALKEAIGEAELGAVAERCLDDRDASIPAIAEAIASLAPHLRAVLTTNIDHLLERAFSGRWPSLARATGNIAQRQGFILKLHGTLYDRSTWVFTEDDQDRAMYADPHLAAAFSALFHSGTLLFVGCDDPGDDFKPFLSRVRALAAGQPPRHFALVAAEKVKPYGRRLLEEAGIRLIVCGGPAGDSAPETRILRDLAGVGQEAVAEQHAPPPSREMVCPFPGLGVFDENRQRFFYGRSDEISEALQLLGDSGEGYRRWLQIEGPSGTGKSSFARAGLVPAVRNGFVHGAPAAWRVAVMRPGRDPVMSLAKAVQAALKAELAAASATLESITNGFSRSEKALALLLREHVPDGHGFLLVADQLEEAFTLADGEGRGRFDKLLAAALRDKGGATYLITTIRSDFTARLGDLPDLARLLNAQASRYYLKPMSLPGLRAAMAEPARLVGLTWEKGLTERIVEDASLSDGGLPLVAHVLQALWAKRDGMTLTHAAYDAVGGVGGALSQSADAILAGLGAAGRERARKLMLRLVGIEQDERAARRSATRAGAVEAAGGGEEAELVLARLSGGRDPDKPDAMVEAPLRLLAVNQAEEGEREDRVDLVHEALLKWPVLRGWIDENRKALERRDDLEAAAAVWEAAGSPADGLPAGAQLAYFRSAEGFSEKARKYLQAAEARERRRMLRLRAIIAALVAGLIGVSGLAKFAFDQREEADQQRALAESRTADAIEMARQLFASINPPREAARTQEDWDAQILTKLRKQLEAGARNSRDAVLFHAKDGDAAAANGDLPRARQEYETALDIVQRLLKNDPTNSSLRRDQFVTYIKLGDTVEKGGDLPAARAYLKKGLEVVKPLSEAHPNDTSLRSDLFVSYTKLGDLAQKGGDLSAAQDYFEQALAVVKALKADARFFLIERNLSITYVQKRTAGGGSTNRDPLCDPRCAPDDPLCVSCKPTGVAEPLLLIPQEVLAMSYDKLGDVAQAGGELKAARGHFEKSLAIRKALFKESPKSVQSQMDLAVVHEKLAEVAHAAKDVVAFRAHRDAATAILDRLKHDGRADSESLAKLRAALAELKE